jgi:hypothetical protein
MDLTQIVETSTRPYKWVAAKEIRRTFDGQQLLIRRDMGGRVISVEDIHHHDCVEAEFESDLHDGDNADDFVPF